MKATTWESTAVLSRNYREVKKMKRQIINSLKVVTITGLALLVFLPGAALAFQPALPAQTYQPESSAQMIDLSKVKVDVAIPGEQKLGSIPPVVLNPGLESTGTSSGETTSSVPSDDGLIHEKVNNFPGITQETTPTEETTPTGSTTPTPENPGGGRDRLPFTGGNSTLYYVIGLIIMFGGIVGMAVRKNKLNSK